MTIKKFSKQYSDIFNIKSVFLENNEHLFQENIRLAQYYISQPPRTQCKNCNASLDNILFKKQNIDYFLCERCNHLNGAYKDTEDFVRHIYLDKTTGYANNYRVTEQEAYLYRVQAIYKPKAEFMIECLKDIQANYTQLSYCDIGSGCGYFVYTLMRDFGLHKVTGYEVSPEQVTFANEILGDEHIKIHQISQLHQIIKTCNHDLISMIGVLEHLREPRTILQAISNNPSVSFLYLSLPLFSYSVFFEFINQDCFNRHLSNGHTHLYTSKSIAHFCSEFGFDVIGEWYFGTDIADSFRFMSLQMKKLKGEKIIKAFSEKFIPIMDDLQEVMDRSEFCSEIHILLKKKNNSDENTNRR